MGQLVEEVKEWNTPIIGAYNLWRFTLGYRDHHPNGDSPIALLHFIVAAISTNKELLEPISRRRDSLQSYVHSFEDLKRSDILVGLQERADSRKEYTMRSIDLAVAYGLLAWDRENGKLIPIELVGRPRRGNALSIHVKREGDKMEILGEWFSQCNLVTIGAYLGIVF